METPFNMIVLGMTNCGETYYLLEMLKRDYRNHFEYIFLICPTYEWNKTYQEWKFNKDKDFFVVQCIQDDVDEHLKVITNIAKGTNSLIILDDCASSQSVKNRTSELVNLAFPARHFGLSTVVITQQLTSIAKPYRENISKLVTFYNPSAKDRKVIFQDYLSCDKNEMDSIVKKLKTTITQDLKFFYAIRTLMKLLFRMYNKMESEANECEALTYKRNPIRPCG